MSCCQVVVWRPGVPRPKNQTCSRTKCVFGLAAEIGHAFLEHVWFLALVPQASKKPLGKKTLRDPSESWPRIDPWEGCRPPAGPPMRPHVPRKVGRRAPHCMLPRTQPGPLRPNSCLHKLAWNQIRKLKSKTKIILVFWWFLAGVRPKLGPRTCAAAPA